MPAPYSSEQVRKAGQAFWTPTGGGLLILVAIHLTPKPIGEANVRLAMTAGYFGALFAVLWGLGKPRDTYMKALYGWRYREGGPALEQHVRLYLSALNRLITSLTAVVAVFLASIAIGVLAKWPPLDVLAPLVEPAGWVWWLSLITLLAFPVWGRSRVSNVMQRKQLLREAVDTADFVPENMPKLGQPTQTQIIRQAPAVEAVRDGHFRAGGIEWDWEDFYKNAVIFGASGTGKTVCVLNALLDGLLASREHATQPPSALILDPKGDFRSKLRTAAAAYGRERDIVVIDPFDSARGIRWNPLDSDDDELEVAARFTAALQAVGMKPGDQDAFWLDSARKFIRHAIALLRIVNGEETPPSFTQINSIAGSMKRLSELADQVADDDPRGDQCLAFFADEWAQLAENTRSSILAYITNMIDPFLMRPYADVFSGRSDLRISDVVEGGKILYVYMPIADKEAMSKVICTFVKLEFFREVLKRPNKERASFFFCDEFQAFFTVTQGKGDADFFERSRQSNHANIIATQNVPALMKAASDRESVVQNLLGNCAVKIFLRNTDDKTNEYASKLFGQQVVAMAGSGMSQGHGRHGDSVNVSANRQYDQKVRQEEFVNLAVPSRADGIEYAETIVHLASRGRVTKERLRWKVHPLRDDA